MKMDNIGTCEIWVSHNGTVQHFPACRQMVDLPLRGGRERRDVGS